MHGGRTRGSCHTRAVPRHLSVSAALALCCVAPVTAGRARWLAASVSEPVREAAAPMPHRCSRHFGPWRPAGNSCVCVRCARAPKPGNAFRSPGRSGHVRAPTHSYLRQSGRALFAAWVPPKEWAIMPAACVRRPTENRERNGLVFLCKSVGSQVSADGGIGHVGRLGAGRYMCC